MRKIRYLSLLMAMLLSVAVMGQNTGGFNPDSPSEPGEPVLPDPPAPTYMLTLVATEGGSIKSGGGRYEEGAEVTVVANAAATNYVFLGWTDEAGNTLSQNLSFTYTMPAKDVTLKANYTFNPNSPAEPSEPDVPEPPAPEVLYTLTLVATEGGSIKSGGGEYKEGTEVTVVANAAATNFVFTGWTDEGGSTVSQTLSYTFAMPARDVTLKANYLFTPNSPSEPSEPEPPTPAPITHVLTVIGGEGGSISVNGTKVNGSASFDIEEEATANITVSLATNYVFDGWYTDGELYSAVKDFTFTMGTQDVTFEARFSYNPDSPSEPSQPEAGGNEVYLMSVVGLPGETINFPVYLNNTDVITDMKFEILFPAKMTPDFTKALYPQAQGYKLEYKRTDIVGELGARPMADASNEGIIEPGEFAVYEVSLTGGVTPSGNTSLLVIPVTIDSDIEKKRYQIRLRQVVLTKQDGTSATTSIRNGAVNTDYEEPDSYSYLYNLISVGSTTCEVTQVAQEDNPVSDTFACDMAGIDQLLVCSEPSFVTFKGLSELGKVTDEFTADNGFWINHDGYVCSATDAARAFCVKFDEAASQLVITQAPNAFSGEDEVNTKVYFTYKYKYYEIAVKLKVLNKSYNVTYYVDDKEYKNVSVEVGATIPSVETPIKTGHTFKEWVGLPEDMIMPGHDIRVDATFDINSYTITFDSNGGSEVASITAEYGMPITKPADPVREGHTFTGWDKEIPETMPAQDMTITALWEANEYIITYIVDGVEWRKVNQKYGTPITPPSPEKEGYTFSGWDEVPETMPAHDIEIKGTFTINPYKVTFVSDGEIIKEETLDYGTTIVAPENPTKVGHTFAGWDPTFEEGATVPAHDVTYTAQFTVNQYTITFDTDGGSEIAPITQDYNTAVTPPADPTKTGYTFAGWDKAIPATMPAEDITIKALWTINSYTLTFDSNGGSEVAAITADYGTPITRPADPVREGYTFSRWEPEIPATMPAEDMTITAQWQINKYTITYYVDGEIYQEDELEYGSLINPPSPEEREGYTFSGWGEVPETMPAHDIEIKGTFTINQYKVTFVSDGEIIKEETLEYGAVITAPEDPTKVGHTFAGWNPTFEEGATVPAHDVTYTALFNVNQYTITFDTDGGSAVAPITQDYNTAVTPPADPTKTGYTFAGWDKAIPATMPAEDITIKALWTINSYKLTYKVDGDVYKQYDIEYNATITPEPNPAREGYTFSGWSEIPKTMPANDVDVTGAFTINQYKVTFISDGVVVKEETLDYGTVITAPENPEKVGHKFECWSSDFADFFEGATVPAHDVTYTAQFSVRSFTFTFDSNGGSEVAPITAPYGSVVTKPEDPEYDGHIFKGWYPKIPDVMPAEDMHFIAEWSLKDFTGGGLNYSVISNTDPDYYVKVAGVEDKSVDVIDVPATVKCEGTEYRIISVGSEAFANIPVLLEVKFNSVVTIPADAFEGSGTETNLFVYAPAGSTCEYKGNVVIDGKAENVVLKDAQPLRISREFTAKKVSYSREFTKKTYPGEAGGWETIVLPFDVEKIESGGVEITPFDNVVSDKHFWLASLTKFGYNSSNGIEANKPYIISMPNSDEYDPEYNISGTVTFSAENAKMILTSNAGTSEGKDYRLVPTYEGVEASSEIYVLNDEESYQHRPGSIFVSGGRSVRPFEAYVTDKDNGAKPLYFEIETATSGIRNIEMEGKAPTGIYDLSGRPASASQKGFVIIRKPNGEYHKIYNK